MPVTATMKGKFDGVLFAEGGELAQYYAKVRKAVTADKLQQFGSLTSAEEQAKYGLDVSYEMPVPFCEMWWIHW